jgi:putative heme degradation protein
VQHIATLARLLCLRLEVASSLILPVQARPNHEQRDFAAKLQLACSEAQLVLRETVPGIARDRVQHIATLCEQLKMLLGGGEVRPR